MPDERLYISYCVAAASVECVPFEALFVAGWVAVVALVVLIVKPSIIAKKEIWKTSALVPQFEPAALWIKGQLPEELLKFYENPPQNSDEIKKTIEKATQKATGKVHNSTEEVEKPTEQMEMPIENLKIDEIGSVEDFTDSDPSG